jgi:cbb3-type cytochrome oxidase maturation protein
MDILIVLIPAALLLGILALAAFLWSLKANQYEDLDGAARRILLDEQPPE